MHVPKKRAGIREISPIIEILLLPDKSPPRQEESLDGLQ